LMPSICAASGAGTSRTHDPACALPRSATLETTCIAASAHTTSAAASAAIPRIAAYYGMRDARPREKKRRGPKRRAVLVLSEFGSRA